MRRTLEQRGLIGGRFPWLIDDGEPLRWRGPTTGMVMLRNRAAKSTTVDARY
jgi:hypothetical protein